MQRWSPRGNPRGVLVSLASSIPDLGLKRVCPQKRCSWLRIFLCSWPCELCPQLRLWYYVFFNAIIIGVKIFLEVGIELEKRVKFVLLLCFAFFT